MSGPIRLWYADLTYTRLKSHFVFLAVLLDAWSRKVVGYAISHPLDARLPLAALEAAPAHRKPPLGFIHHSDRGVQAGFNRSSQHRTGAVYDDDEKTAAIRSSWARYATITRSASRRAT